MSESWFVRQRQEWIAETIEIFGFINREHIERKFGVSTPQASMDLRQFQTEHPGAIEYNRSSKRYEPIDLPIAPPSSERIPAP